MRISRLDYFSLLKEKEEFPACQGADAASSSLEMLLLPFPKLQYPHSSSQFFPSGSALLNMQKADNHKNKEVNFAPIGCQEQASHSNSNSSRRSTPTLRKTLAGPIYNSMISYQEIQDLPVRIQEYKPHSERCSLALMYIMYKRYPRNDTRAIPRILSFACFC